jgi:hypothetical protein
MRGLLAQPGRSIAALGVCAAALFSAAAHAKVYSEWQPRLMVGAGYDDNILLDASGGDAYGQVVPGLKLYLFGDHGMRTVFDCQVGLSRLARPGLYAAAGGDSVMNQLCGVDFRSRLGTRTALRFSIREQYSQDPFAVSNLGLLLRAGQQRLFHGKVTSELSYRGSQYGTWIGGVDAMSMFFTAGDPGNGLVVTPHLRYERRFTARDSWSLGVREQGFYALGDPTSRTQQRWGLNATGYGSTALAGYKHRFNAFTLMEVTAGPVLLLRPGRSDMVPVGRLDIEAATPTNGLHLTLLHDLVLGPSLGGPLLGDLAELALTAQLVQGLQGHLRGGIYRNEVVGGTSSGIIGYSAGVGLDWHMNRAWVLGATVGREARLSGEVGDHTVDRNVVQLRLTWELPRDW